MMLQYCLSLSCQRLSSPASFLLSDSAHDDMLRATNAMMASDRATFASASAAAYSEPQL